MKRILLFLLNALLIALLLFTLREWLRPAYLFVVSRLTALLPGAGGGVTLFHDSMTMAIPFVALLLATPQMPWRRKAAMLLIGVSVFVAIDMGSFFFTKPIALQHQGISNLPPSLGFFKVYKAYARLLLPLALWLLFSYRYLGDLFNIELARTGSVREAKFTHQSNHQ